MKNREHDVLVLTLPEPEWIWRKDVLILTIFFICEKLHEHETI